MPRLIAHSSDKGARTFRLGRHRLCDRGQDREGYSLSRPIHGNDQCNGLAAAHDLNRFVGGRPHNQFAQIGLGLGKSYTRHGSVLPNWLVTHRARVQVMSGSAGSAIRAVQGLDCRFRAASASDCEMGVGHWCRHGRRPQRRHAGGLNREVDIGLHRRSGGISAARACACFLLRQIDWNGRRERVRPEK